MELLHRHNILFASEDISNTPILTDDDISNNPVITIGKDEDENINDKIPDNIQDQLDTDETRVKIASEDISLDTTFLSWEEVEDFLKDYGQRNGFAITKYRMKKNRSTQLITKRTFVCEFGGKFKSKKSESALQAGKQRNTRTKKCQCPWHINFTFPERATCITVSLFANQHNHELRPDAFEFSSKYREFTKEMIDEIEIMTRYGNLSITLQRNLLKARFPKMNCSDSDLSNAIQKFKSLDRSNMHNDASDLLINLVQKKQEDPRLSERLTSELQWKRFHEYRSATTNSILLSTGDDLFPSITEILEKYLTINIATTIKEEMSQCLYLQATIISFSEVDFIQDQEMEEHDGFIEDNYNVQMIKLQSIIDEIGKEDIKEIWKICDIRPEKRRFFHYIAISNEISFLCSCLTTISKGVICCHYFRVMMSSKIAGFHISMIPERWYQDAYQGMDLSQENNLVFAYEKGTTDNTDSDNILLLRKEITIPKCAPILKKAIDKKTKYGRLWGMAREATLLALESNDNEMEVLLKEYINKRKRQRGLNLVNNDDNIQEEQSDNNTLINEEYEHHELKNIQNPLRIKTKGRPPTKRFKSSVEIEKSDRNANGGSSSRNTYKCRICGQAGHNAAYHKNNKLKERVSN
ncbi:unnamed protein product [Rhizophagus irregularis]|nr:unnamed protein product [Rhizophagus irregularis]